MPTVVSYPGVYIEEIPSGVRTLTGVATSITAFLGNARRGPVNWPVTIFSYADFERSFGGLWVESDLSYAVRDFFLNGGSQAVIVRLFEESLDTNDDPIPAIASVDLLQRAALPADNETITINAASPGDWGNSLEIQVDHDVDSALEATGSPTEGKFFNLTVIDQGSGQEEKFRNVTLAAGSLEMHPGYLPKVLESRSSLVRMDEVTLPDGRLDETFLRNASDELVDEEGNVITDPTTNPPIPTFLPFINGNDGEQPGQDAYLGSAANKEGLYALENTDLFNLLCIPNMMDIGASITTAAESYCKKRRAMLLIDASAGWVKVEDAISGVTTAPVSENAALFFPRLRQPDPLRDGQLVDRAPCGAVAGVIARTDATRGIWKAPAGLDATLNGVPKLTVAMTDEQNGLLNPIGVNCLRTRPAAGRVIWGARTRKGDDRLSSEWKYIPVRRLALYIEESLYRGTQWVVFEPNDEPLWAQIRLNVGAFMNNLFRQGAFQGAAPAEAYFVKCDKETTTQNDINQGIVNIVVGFAPLKPAEFVIIKLQQIAGEVAA